MGTAEVPDFLTVEEAARVLRIGRTLAYRQAHHWLKTGTEGMPARWVGDSLRVPRAHFEQHYDVRITAIPPADARRRPTAPKAEDPAQPQDIPRSTPTARARKARKTAQGGLPFAG